MRAFFFSGQFISRPSGDNFMLTFSRSSDVFMTISHRTDKLDDLISGDFIFRILIPPSFSDDLFSHPTDLNDLINFMANFSSLANFMSSLWRQGGSLPHHHHSMTSGNLTISRIRLSKFSAICRLTALLPPRERRKKVMESEWE